MTRTFSGFHSVNAFTGEADQARHDCYSAAECFFVDVYWRCIDAE